MFEAWDQDEPPGELVVLGGPPLVGESVDVPAMVGNLKHTASVRIVGEVPEIEPYLDSADVVVIPSDQPEPFGLVAIEAFARGRMVVASRGGGLLEIITPSRDGIFFTPQNSSELRDILTGLDRPITALYGDAARQTYLEKFCPLVFREQFDRFWTEVPRNARE